MTLSEAKALLITAYQTGRSAEVRKAAEQIQKRANLSFAIAALGGISQKAQRANGLDHYVSRVLVALEACDKRGWTIGTTATLLASINH